MDTQPGFHEKDLLEPIAIVGTSLRFPGGANDLNRFWKLITDARCVSQEYPSDRINTKGAYWPPGSSTVKGGHFLAEDITAFDAPFFGISAVEAASIDPQQRLLLETSYMALENAGIPISKVTGSNTSVYVGCFTDDYKTLYQKDLRESAPYAATGITTTLNANRISWFYNMTGPSVNIDTACSSSLVALDIACQGLREGRCNLSLVGGANLLLAPDLFHTLSGMNMLSRDSRCYSFDARGNGYGRGEGVGMLVLKRITHAVRDGDTIRAVIRSTACNQNGHTPGITQPSSLAQEALINECYARAGLDKCRTTYVEAHGTGTPAGDPIEAEALGASFKSSRRPGERLYVGSVKANIGHLEGSSGIAGVIKAIAMLERGCIPGIADLQTINPMIDEMKLGLALPRSALIWPSSGLRRISVNSFGFGGSNAHAILDDAYHFLLEHGLDGIAYPPSTSVSATPQGFIPVRVMQASVESVVPQNRQPLLLPLSSSDEDGIKRIAHSLCEYLSSFDETGVSPGFYEALAYTLAQRRTSFPWRACAILPSDKSGRDFEKLVSATIKSRSTIPKIAFVFTGQGAQWAQMGLDLCIYPTFCRRMNEANCYLKSIGCNWDVLGELAKPKETSQIDEPVKSQTICTAIQVALTDLLREFGVTPSVAIGHSSGEIAAAYASGAIAAQDAWKISYFRGLLVSKMRDDSGSSGAMLAVGLTPSEASAFLMRSQDLTKTSVGIACFNSPKSVTLSGCESEIDSLKANLDAAGVFARKLRTGVAYHSNHMYPVANEYADLVGSIDPPPKIDTTAVMISSVHGHRVAPDVLRKGSYWASNLVSPVRFLQAFQTLLTKRVAKKVDGSHKKLMDIDTCLEIGPHGALRGPIRDILTGHDYAMTYLSALQRELPGVGALLGSVGHLWCLGSPINWHKVNQEDCESILVSLSDLPPYPWDHSRSYFHESRVSNNHRLCETPRSPLLGEAAVDWNSLEAQWRNFIKISEHSWVEDHQINGTTLFPAAGMIAMAVEAIKQLNNRNPTRPILGYELSDINLINALVIPDNERGVETQLFVHRQYAAAGWRESPWSNFRLCAYIESEWVEICTGCIRVDYGAGNDRAGKEHLIRHQKQDDLISERKDTSQHSFDAQTFYQDLRNYGLEFGPSFQTLSQAEWTNSASRAVVTVHPASEYVVHPCTLDALLHLPMVALTQNPERPKSTAIPAKIRRIWLDASGLSHQSVETINATSIVVAEDRRGCEVQSHALNSTRTSILAQVEGLRLAVVNTTAKNSSNSQEADREQFWNLVWQPDIDLMTLTERQQWCIELPNDSESDTDELAGFYRDLAFLHYSYLKQVINDDMTPQQPHLQQYLQWAKEQVQRVESGRTPHWGDDWKMLAKDLGGRQVIENKLLETNAQGKAHVEVARHLDQILAGRLDPLEFLFTSPLLDNLYAELSDHRMACFMQLDRYLKLFAHKTPNARYLEIGAGTGGTTAAILSSLQGDEAGVGPAGTLYQDFTYSDISEAFFDAAKSRFGRYPNMLFHQLDISKNVTHQGFIEGSYDVIVAANVLHATEDLRATLETVQTLLRPGGKLILFEITAPELGRSGFIMGLLPGWWLSSEVYRPRGPCVASATWNTLFEETGFTGLEHEFCDYTKDESHELSVLITSKKPKPSAAMLQRQTASESATDTINIVPSSIGLSKENGYFNNAIAIQKYLRGIGLSSQLISMDKISRSTGLTIVTADLDLERSFLEKMCPEDFAAMQNLISHSQNLVWVTRTVDDGSSSPSYNMIAGLARVIHAEEEGHRLLRVGLEPISSDGPSELQIKGLLSAIQQMIVAASADTFEMEFEQRNGLFQIPRLKLDTECQDGIHEILHPQVSRDLPWNQAPLPLRLTTETPGLFESLRFVVDEDQQKVPLADDEVEIEVRAVGVNFKDCLIALGRVPAETLGNECAGIVTRVGASYRSKFTIGDRVCMSTVEAFKTFARSKAQGVCRLPDSMDFTTAAAIPTQFVTAWTSLREIGRLTRGESVLIHAGAGGTGQAAVQISQYLGAEVFVTVSSDAKKRLLTTTYGIPENHIFYSRDTSFAVCVKNATGGRGVNLVLNSLSGDSLLASWDCLAPYGRFVEIGKKDILENASLPMLPFNRGVSFSAFDGSIWMLERPEQAERGIHAIMDLFKQNVFHVAEPLQIRPVSEVREAFAALADGKTSGKTVISITPTAIVPMTIPRVSSLDTGFPSDATYVLAGGFGGIGRSIARWMAQRGARSLLILSRSGPRTPEACSLVEELTSTGVAVQAPVCDITDSRALQSVISECQKNMSPIRGCIQASMVLQDTLYRDMTHTQWAAAVDPKVAGTWNLHTCLEKERLSFFICLSSVSGVAGQRGQSNYAAGNTFQDSLARYRIARGQPAVSLDLGAMVDDGFLAQNQAVRERLLGGGSMLPITREKFLALLEYYCCRLPVAGIGNSQLTIANSQTVFGVNSPQAMYARGLDLPNWMQRPIFSLLHRAFSSSQQTHRGRNQRDFRAEIAQATTIENATQIIADALVSKLVRSLSALEAEEVKVDMPIVSYGVDSLLAVEIRSWLGSTFQADVPTFEILGGIDFERLGRLVAIRSTAKKGWA